ncbi:hypothetical protein DFH06DRAFT_1336497 [Mycena polygramma]|nr:hypothetical protein DFH06DRAFT_1336497 [Mycena polygramma]
MAYLIRTPHTLVLAASFWAIQGIDFISNQAGTCLIWGTLREVKDFHHTDSRPGDELMNYNNRAEVQTCGLNHLATRDEHGLCARHTRGVREHLLFLGVVKMPLDAAKRIPAADIADIVVA